MGDAKITNGNLILNGGDFARVSGREALKQRLLIRFKTLLGEWFLDPSEGVDYQTMLKKPFSKAYCSREIRRVMVQDPDVQAILDISITEDLFEQKARIRVKYRDTYSRDPQTLETNITVNL